MDGCRTVLTVECGAGQYVVGETGRGFETLLVITLSPDLWCPEENKEGGEENAGGCSTSACS